jgi:tetratricopeptide (TPR) repeat protein
MSNSLIHCPACKKLLRSDRPVPVGATLRCPECRAGFSAPPPLPDPPTARVFGPLFFTSVAVALILGGSVITAALVLTTPRPQPAETKKDDAAERRLAEEQKKLDDARKELEDGKKRLDLAGLVADGKAALAAGRFEAAEKAFNDALKIDPKDSAAIDGLVAARSGRAAGKKDDEERQRRDAERDRLLAEGREALAAKLYARAVRALEAARALAPTDATVLAAINEARTALEADEDQKKKLAEYNARLAAGKTALEAGKYTDAVREYTAALTAMPDSAEAKDGLKQAEAKLAALGDREKTNKAFDAAIARARAAIVATKFNEAIAEIDGALRLIPDDREGKRLLTTTKETLEKVKTSNAKLVAAARIAAGNGQMEEAVRLAQKAVAAWAEDEKAKKALKEAERVVDTGRTNVEAYQRYVQAGELAMATGKYGDAVVAYTEALRLNPTNADLAIALRNARIAQENYVRHRVEYERLIAVGSRALAARQFGEALKAFQAAKKLLPFDLAARDGINKAKYGQAMVDGQQALKLRQKAEAIAAFEAALAALPGDTAALRGLALAKMLR